MVAIIRLIRNISNKNTALDNKTKLKKRMIIALNCNKPLDSIEEDILYINKLFNNKL